MPKVKTAAAAAAAAPVPVDKPAPGIKKMSCSFFTAPAPPPARKIRANRSGDASSSALCKMTGVVTSTKLVNFKSAKGDVKKKMVTVIVTDVDTNGAQDVIRTGVPGEIYLLPSKQVEITTASADGEGGEAKPEKMKSNAREIVVNGTMQRARKLSVASASFYMEAKRPDPNDANAKQAPEPGVNQVDVGSLVTISGVHANFAVGKSGIESLYINALGCTPIQSSKFTAGEAAEHIIALNSQPEMQAWAAFTASMAANGFFETSQLNPAQKIQAEACQALWKRVTEGAADRLKIMAEGKSEEVADILSTHESRIRNNTPADQVASGNNFLFVTDQYDSTICPLVMSGATPWDPNPGLLTKLLEGGEAASSLPNSFCIARNTNIEIRGGAMQVEFGGLLIFDKESALEAIDAGADEPWLQVPLAGSVTITMTNMAHKIGNRIQAKTQMAVKEILPYADEACFAKMHHLEAGGVKSEFPEGSGKFISMPSTLAKTSILVTEEFVKKSLCGGGDTYAPDDLDPSKTSLYDMPADANGLMPSLKTHYYKELTFATFSTSNFEDAPKETGRELQYRVIYEGVTNDLSHNKALASDAVKGEEHLTTAQSMDDENSTMKKFLMNNCLVYAVLVPPAPKDDDAMEE